MTIRTGSAPAAASVPAASVPAASVPAAPEGRRALRAALLVPAAVALLAGLDAALLRLGLPAPIRTDRLPAVHGMLLVFGFLTTLIALERAVALRHPAGFTAPVLTGLGGLALLSPAPLKVGQITLLAGVAVFAAVHVPLWRRQRAPGVAVQAFAAALGAGALLLWLGDVTVPALLPWLVAFLVLTVAAERLELARLDRGTPEDAFVVLAAAVGVGAVAALLWPEAGTVLFGLTLLSLLGWLVRYDVARRTVRSRGLPRYVAGCTLAAYGWLAVAAAAWVLGGPAPEGPRYDAVVHAVFLGFTMSMVFAHAPVILPAVLRCRLPYHPVLIVPAALLHASLVVRLWLGDARGHHGAWQAGGVGNIAALLVFAGVAVALAGGLLRPGSRDPR